jgi:hypothetical protein
MVEHDEKLFEHKLSEKFAKLDKDIKIPEIPDVQNIFDRAENEKAKVIPFKKYSRYIAAAAAVVLICVSVPLLSPALSAETAPQEPMEVPKMFDNMADAVSDTVVAEEPCEAAPEEETSYPEFSITESENPVNEPFDGTAEKEAESVSETENALEEMLFEFFNSTVSDELKDSSAASSSDANPSTGGSGTNPELGGAGDSERDLKLEYRENGDLSLLYEKINKKRNIEIVIEEDSVSVMLFDTSAGDEVISAFWVEGAYQFTQPGEESYVIYLTKKIAAEDFEAGNYIPMAGDSVNGTYFVSDENISLPRKVIYGEYFITVIIDLKTGEYKIYANLR